MNELLDVEFLEVDPLTRREKSNRAMLRQEEYILNEGLKTQQVNHIEEDDADAGPPSDDE